VRIARFALESTVAYGLLEPAPGQQFDPLSAQVRPMRGHPYGELDLVDLTLPLASVRLLPPVLPTKIIGIGKNYAEHAAEMDSAIPAEPLAFLKPNTAVVGPLERIRIPEQSQRVDYEGEMAVVIGHMCRHVDAVDASRVILGYTCANDVTARDLQARDNQWARAKGFDTFCPLGPWIETDLDPGVATVTTTVNGEVRQRGSTADMIFDVGSLVAWVSSVMTLLPGDVILTGTPAGIGQLHDGDHVKVEVSGIGALDNEVILGD
jgi:2-keto-4-pentenoate hydratase/2-oxohepta-3-ene-1,7-dioic acid hydratase in catechol pathway